MLHSNRLRLFSLDFISRFQTMIIINFMWFIFCSFKKEKKKLNEFIVQRVHSCLSCKRDLIYEVTVHQA